MKKYIKPLGLIALIIIGCTVISHALSGSESLLEYQERNGQETVVGEEISTTDETNTAPSTFETEQTTTAETPTKSAQTETSEETTSTEQAATASDNDVTLSFYYEPLSEEIINRITGISYVENDNISLDELRYMHVLHYDFDGQVTEGELICNEAIAQDLLEIFYELYLAEYKIEKIRLIDEYNGDDTASMEDNNTSCFNYRVVDGTTKLSKHAYGLALDINPFYNPYVVFQSDGSTYISPKGSEIYTDRSADFPYKIDENDLCYKLFTEHGFTWGGSWNSCKDYQHFQKAN